MGDHENVSFDVVKTIGHINVNENSDNTLGLLPLDRHRNVSENKMFNNDRPWEVICICISGKYFILYLHNIISTRTVD